MLDPSGIVTNWNAGAERIKGYRAEEIVGRHFSVFYTAGGARGGGPTRALRMQPGKDVTRRKAGACARTAPASWPSVMIDAIRDETGDLIGFAKITRDITERRATRTACARASGSSGCWSRASRITLCTCSIPDGIVTSWNAGAERIKGYTAEEIIGQHFSRFYTEPIGRQVCPARALATAAQTGSFEAEGWRVRKDGSRSGPAW